MLRPHLSGSGRPVGAGGGAPVRSWDIAAIHVEGYGATRSMCDRPDPNSAQEARFSLQYCLAAQMLLGAVRLSAFSAEALADPAIRDLAQRITVTEAEDLIAAYPGRRMARLEVQLKDGRHLRRFQPGRRGDPEDPLDDAGLFAKFEELAGSVLAPDQVGILRDQVMEGRGLPGPVPFSEALAAEPAA